MPIVTLNTKTIPQSSKALRTILQNALEKASPVEDFIQIVRDLARYETQYGHNSQEFFEHFQRGEMGDQIDYIRWANKYEMYQEMKTDMEVLFELLEQYALPVSV